MWFPLLDKLISGLSEHSSTETLQNLNIAKHLQKEYTDKLVVQNAYSTLS